MPRSANSASMSQLSAGNIPASMSVSRQASARARCWRYPRAGSDYCFLSAPMEQIYQYLIGPRFRQRLEGIIEKFEELKGDLDKERKFMNRVWAKREGQIQGVIEATVGMYGDLQGIAGKALPEIPSLDMPMLEAPETD
jgi:hypothetical protein